VVKEQLWVITKEYDVANCKTNIVSVEPYEEFITKHGVGYAIRKSTDMIQAIDALDAWKKTRELYSERD
jgi:hypothetical protein